MLEARNTPMLGVLRLGRQVHEDARGTFSELWSEEDAHRVGLPRGLVQGNLSTSCRGALRGLHHQVRRPQGKLLWVVRGALFDVVVDLRRSSPSFGSWHAEELRAPAEGLWIPPGFAHGFQALSDETTVLYVTTDRYEPEDQQIIAWDASDLGIPWPLRTGGLPILSHRDARDGVLLRDAESHP